MPEIGEVARTVHFLRSNVVGKTIRSIVAHEDNLVFKDTTSTAFAEALKGQKVLAAKQQGKYFWLEMSGGKHPLMHFGMNGWVRYSHIESFYYHRNKKHLWPPKYAKFIVEMESDPPISWAYTDSRRFGRVRLMECKAEDMRNIEPLSVNGPDPVVDRDKFTLEWFTALVNKRKAPIKAVLLEQKNISGIGNWVGDEILYHAKVHPEQYSHTLEPDQIKSLYESLIHVCDLACETLSESDKFPQHWLFKHRWGKNKSNKHLPNGEEIHYVTVGGRTSAFIPTVQKKTGPVAADVDEEEGGEAGEQNEEAESKPKPKKSRKKTATKEETDETEPNETESKPKKVRKKAVPKEDVNVKDETEEEVKPRSMKATAKSGKTKAKPTKKETETTPQEDVTEKKVSRKRKTEVKEEPSEEPAETPKRARRSTAATETKPKAVAKPKAATKITKKATTASPRTRSSPRAKR